MPDPYADALARDVLGAAQEWCRRTGLGPEDTNLRPVWMDDGTVELWDEYRARVAGPFRVTVLVEPAGSWEQKTWADVHDGDRVSLGGVEADVESVTVQRWHVKPGTGTAKWNPPVPQEHDIVVVHLAGRSRAYEMPPTGPVMILMGSPTGPAVKALLDLGPIEVISE